MSWVAASTWGTHGKSSRLKNGMAGSRGIGRNKGFAVTNSLRPVRMSKAWPRRSTRDAGSSLISSPTRLHRLSRKSARLDVTTERAWSTKPCICGDSRSCAGIERTASAQHRDASRTRPSDSSNRALSVRAPQAPLSWRIAVSNDFSACSACPCSTARRPSNKCAGEYLWSLSSARSSSVAASACCSYSMSSSARRVFA